jgi:hypothetical protein
MHSDEHRIPHYRVENIIGHGSFATVYLGFDEVWSGLVGLDVFYRELDKKSLSRPSTFNVLIRNLQKA